MKEINLSGYSNLDSNFPGVKLTAGDCFAVRLDGKTMLNLGLTTQGSQGGIRLRLTKEDARALAQLLLDNLEGAKPVPKVCIFENEGRLDGIWSNIPGLLVAEVNRELEFVDPDEPVRLVYELENGRRATEKVTTFDWGPADFKPRSVEQIYRQVNEIGKRRKEEIALMMKA